MTTQDILELAARVEAATGPDRELDGLIEVARDPMRETILYNEPGRFPQKAVRGPVRDLVLSGADLADYISAPRYTASLDAAMTLVPAGWHVGTLCENWDTRKWRCAVVQLPNDGQRRAFSEGKTFGVEAKIAEAATGPLALTAAALKARAHTKGEE